MPSDRCGWETCTSFLMGGTGCGENWILLWWAGPCSVSQFSHSVVSDTATPGIAACQASLSIISSQSLLKLMSFESEMPSNHLILCHSLLLPSVFSSIRVFSSESVFHIRWPKYWSFSFSFSISPSNEYSGLISFRMDWLDLLVVQATLKSPLQHDSSKASILRYSAFSMLQKLDLVLVGRTLLSKYLIQFSGDGQGCAPSLLFGLRQPSPGVCSLYGRVMVFKQV